MKIAIFETDHPISQTVCRSIAGTCGFDLYNYGKNAPNLHRYDAVIGYGILRGMKELYASHPHWFEIDKGFTDAEHYTGNYRLSYKGTQPIYEAGAPQANHGEVSPGRHTGYTLICPPTDAVCGFFGINLRDWATEAFTEATIFGGECLFRTKGDTTPIEWDEIDKLVTFNSSLGFEALRRCIPVVSDPIHSTIGSYQKNAIDPSDMNGLFSFASAHQFKLGDKEGIHWILKRYLSGSATIQEKQSLPMSASTRYFVGQPPKQI